MKATELNAIQRGLLPCPFCGGAGKLEPIPKSSWWKVRCELYECGGTTWAASESGEAGLMWNRRPADVGAELP